jgi:hypothetical protein
VLEVKKKETQYFAKSKEEIRRTCPWLLLYIRFKIVLYGKINDEIV